MLIHTIIRPVCSLQNVPMYNKLSTEIKSVKSLIKFKKILVKYVLHGSFYSMQELMRTDSAEDGNYTYPHCHSVCFVQGGLNMTWTNCDFTHKSYRSYLNHLVYCAN
jgi:hypothetical protein